MNRMITRLMCVGIACLCMLPAMGQEDVNLRANDKQQPDSIVRYNGTGYKTRVYYEVKNEMPTPYFDESFAGGQWMFPNTHCSAGWDGFGLEDYEVKYNSQGQVESVSYLSDNTIKFRQFQYDENGYLISNQLFTRSAGSNESEWTAWGKNPYFYDAYGNWVGKETSGGATINGKIIITHFSTYKAHVDNEGKIVCSYEIAGENVQFEDGEKMFYYIWYYSDGRTPNAEVENNTPIDNNQGNFDLNINIPVDSVQNGSLVVQLPDGFTLDEANTSLTIEFAGLFDLTITKQENNSWLIEIKQKSLKSAALRADEIGKMLHFAYKVDDSVQKGTYNISINSIQFKTPGDNIIPEPAITVPVNVNRWGVGNDQIEDSNTAVYITGNTLYIQTAQTEQITVYTINGSKLYEAAVPSGTTTIDAGAFPQGVLIVKGSSGWVKKVVK